MIAPPPKGGFRTDYGTFGAPHPTAVGGVPSAPTPGGAAADPYAQYTSMIQANPAYMAWQASSIRNLSDAATSRKAAIRALAEQFGGLPAGFADKYGDLSASDLSLAQQNPYSVEANLSRTYHGNVSAMRKALAARGALHSGDLGFNQNQLDTQYGQDQYNAGQQFAQELSAAMDAYTQAQDADRQAQAQAIQQAYQDILSNPAYMPSGG